MKMSDHSSESFAIKAGVPVICQDIAREDRFEFPDFMTNEGVRALANVPIFLPGRRAYGLLQVDDTKPREFVDEDTEFLRTYATLLGPVIDRLQKVVRLHRAEERFRLVVSHVRDYAIFRTDEDDIITDWLPGAEAVFGWTPEEAVGQPGSLIFTPEDKERGEPEKEINTAREHGSAPNVRWHLHKDGRRIFIDGSVTALHERGSEAGFLKVGQDVTQKRLGEERLRESEVRYRTLFEEMDEGFVVCELVRDAAGRAVDFRYVELNSALRRHVGIDPEALRGRLAKEAFPDREPWYLETYARVVESGQSVLEEHHFPHVDRWLRLNVFPRGADRFAVLYSDISERKRAEAELRASERRQAFLLRFTDAIRSEPNEEALIERAVQMLAEELAADRAYATRHHPAADLTNVVYEVRAPDLAPLPATLRFSDFPEAGRQTFEKTLIFEDTASDHALTEADKAALASMGVGALLSRPLRRHGSPIFALGVVSTLPRRWTPSDIALVEEAAERTWEAAERVRGEAALRQSEERQRVLVEGIPQLVWRSDGGGMWRWASSQWTSYTGQTPEQSRGYGWLDALHPDDREAAMDGWRQADGSSHLDMDTRLFHAGEERYRWFQTRALPVRGENGQIIEWLGTSTDVDDLRQLQEAQSVMVAELQHRTRNLIGVVRSMANQTLSRSTTLEGFKAEFGNRLDALSRVQGLLSRSGEEHVTIGDLVHLELEALGADMGERVAAEGPAVPIRKTIVQTLSLALHELATNARKYGALAGDEGRLSVRWTTYRENGEKRRLRVEWIESGVPDMPPPGDAPKGGGYGRHLIEKALPYQLKAETRYELTSDGVHCTIDLPLTAS